MKLSKRAKIILSVLGVVLLASCCLVVVSGVFLYRTLVGDPPGKGQKAEQGYQACEPIIQALAQYHSDHQTYPESLEDLVPAYLPQLPESPLYYPIQYKKLTGSYELEFSYEGPGMNRCQYFPDSGWNCYGYY